jgi:hypothetical protein
MTDRRNKLRFGCVGGLGGFARDALGIGCFGDSQITDDGDEMLFACLFNCAWRLLLVTFPSVRRVQSPNIFLHSPDALIGVLIR